MDEKIVVVVKFEKRFIATMLLDFVARSAELPGIKGEMRSYQDENRCRSIEERSIM